jgi:hypothetical protein
MNQAKPKTPTKAKSRRSIFLFILAKPIHTNSSKCISTNKAFLRTLKVLSNLIHAKYSPPSSPLIRSHFSRLGKALHAFEACWKEKHDKKS